MDSSSQSRPKRRLHITCAAWTCKSPKTGVSYHRFPKDQSLNQQWRILCRVGDVKEPRICSRHFLPEDFKRDLVNELLNRPTKKLLKSDAVPSLYLYEDQEASQGPSQAQRDREEEKERRKREELIQRLLTKGPDPPPFSMEPRVKHVGVQVEEATSSEYQCQLAKLQAKNNRLQSLIDQQKAKIAELRASLRKIQGPKDLSFPQKSLSEGPPRRKKAPKWSREDMVNALRLRQVSPKSYAFIRRSGHFSLPGMSTLRNWIQEFRVEPGVQELAWSILKERLRAEDPKFKLASIVFDEIECGGGRGGDFHETRVRKMQVVILRGLFHKWSYVVYQDLDSPLSKSILDELIVRAEGMGLQVWTLALSMDNKEIMEEVILKNSCFTFSNPADETRHIYIFPSMPSVMKHARNTVFDLGVMLDSENTLCRSDFEQVKDLPSSKLKDIHVTVQGMDRHINRLALQTFSLSVSKDMETLEYPASKVNALRILDAYIDVFNSQAKTYKNKVGSAFGVFLDEQISAIKEAEDLAIDMRVMDPLSEKAEGNMFPFQYGMIIGIQSLIELYNEVVVRRGALDFIFTRHLTTDIVQAYAHKMGGLCDEYETEAIYKRSRLVMMGRKSGDSAEEDPNSIETLEPLFGALPKTDVPSKKKTVRACGYPAQKKRKLEEDIPKKTSSEDKLLKMESFEALELPPEIYIF